MTPVTFIQTQTSYRDSILNDELHNFDVWLKCNELLVNLQKTYYIIFKSRQKKSWLQFYPFNFLGNQSLNPANLTKFLGIYADEHLTWKHLISFIGKQISKSVGIIFRSRFYLSSRTKLTLYYCKPTWSSTYVSTGWIEYFICKNALCEPLLVQIIEHTPLPYLLNWVS